MSGTRISAGIITDEDAELCCDRTSLNKDSPGDSEKASYNNNHIKPASLS